MARERINWSLLGMWVVLSGVSWAGYAFITFITASGSATIHLGLMNGALVGAFWGVGVGLSQWIILRLVAQQAGWWIIATALGWTVGVALGWLVLEYIQVPVNDSVGSYFRWGWALRGCIGSAVTGIVIAVSQWVILRHWVRQALLWPVAIALAWAIAPILAWLVGVSVGLLQESALGDISMDLVLWLIFLSTTTTASLLSGALLVGGVSGITLRRLLHLLKDAGGEYLQHPAKQRP